MPLPDRVVGLWEFGVSVACTKEESMGITFVEYPFKVSRVFELLITWLFSTDIIENLFS